VGGQKLRASTGFNIIAKIATKKFQRWGFLDFVFKFCSHKIFSPLTLTLSPQTGRGDKKELFFYSKKKN
jgi:hypothetical protein